MGRTSNPDELTARLESRMEAERRQFQETTKSALRRLGANSRAVVNDNCVPSKPIRRQGPHGSA